MSVLIKGMEMPKNCGLCFLRVGQCSRRIYMKNRPSDCPLIEVPEPHGRLIDADALHKLFEDQMELKIKFDEKMIAETANRVLDEFKYNGKTIREWADLIANPKTNADKIRTLTDEELVEFFCDMIQDCGCNNVPCQKFCALKKTCEQAWLDWLKQEVET